MELYTNAGVFIDCAEKHGHKYGHAAIQSIDLLAKLAPDSSCSLRDFSFAPEATLIHIDETKSLEERLAETRSELVRNGDLSDDEKLDFKYAVHLLDRVNVSPFEVQNEVTRGQLDFVRSKIENACDVNINDAALGMRRVKFLSDALEWKLNDESADDLYTILCCERFFVSRLLHKRIPVSILRSFWDHISPEKYSNIDGRIMKLHSEVSKILNITIIDEAQISAIDYLKFQMKAAEELYAGVKMLASFADFGAHLRQAMEWIQTTAQTITLEGNYIDGISALPVIKTANLFLVNMMDLNPPSPHIQLSLDAALAMCGAETTT